MIKITVEDTDLGVSVTGQFVFDEKVDGSAYDYVRRSADRTARQLFMRGGAQHLVLALDKP
jgi:hypothetical protein